MRKLIIFLLIAMFFLYGKAFAIMEKDSMAWSIGGTDYVYVRDMLGGSSIAVVQNSPEYEHRTFFLEFYNPNCKEPTDWLNRREHRLNNTKIEMLTRCSDKDRMLIHAIDNKTSQVAIDEFMTEKMIYVYVEGQKGEIGAYSGRGFNAALNFLKEN
ncbi:hypothetical protein MACH09_45540 [Vibrio sp. MACH09]|uniref:hypothetical protein n=1 Tax=Vibrio sp. MACH09 TaxID=3025122 RepID=UPI00278D2385|nr:hypothetical protein [Vibrio sp. MACH09]GLO64046.1 hypothetical protein MACH09_45540 [Vibrio sp. MACH09]